LGFGKQDFERHYGAALSLAHQNRLRESIPHFLEARKIEPRHPDFQRTLFPILVSLLQEEAAAVPALKLAPLPAEPLVSVIVPTRNRPSMLRDALHSISRQTYQNHEIVVVNDGGEAVAPALPSVRVIDMKSNRGPAAARNAAIAASKGEVLAFLDDDDRYRPDHLALLVAGVQQGFAYTTAELVQETLTGGARRETARQVFMGGLRYSRLLLLVRNFIPINTWGVRRECWPGGGFDERLHYLEDWDLLLRLSSLVPFRQVDALTVEYRVTDARDDSLSKRHGHKQAVQELYARHACPHELVKLARELYLESL
jgi:glycosyltransferase involved in cell wall biosynthesis